MKKIILIFLILVVATGTGFARGGGGHGGGGHGGGGRWGGHGGGYYRGGGHWGGGYGWRHCPRGYRGGYWGGGYGGNVFWGAAAGSAVGSLITGVFAQPQQIVVQQVTPVVSPAYIDTAKYVVTCPNCGQQVDCTTVPRGAHASCPYCKTIMY